jgi:hypothetical protein
VIVTDAPIEPEVGDRLVIAGVDKFVYDAEPPLLEG